MFIIIIIILQFYIVHFLINITLSALQQNTKPDKYTVSWINYTKLKSD